MQTHQAPPDGQARENMARTKDAEEDEEGQEETTESRNHFFSPKCQATLAVHEFIPLPDGLRFSLETNHVSCQTLLE